MKTNHIALALGLLVLGGCKRPEDSSKGKGDIPSRPVRVQPVQTGEIIERFEVTGELQGIEEVRVFAQVPERIRTLAVKEGDTVRQGDLLATVLSDLQSEGVRQAQAMLDAALANRDALQDNVRRTRTLVEGGGGARGQLETLEAQARAADAQVRQAAAAVGQASLQQSRTIIRSPISGKVAQVNFRLGDMATPTMPLMTIVRDDSLKAVLRVPERDFLRVREGLTARISPLATPDVVVEGKVTIKGPMVDRLTRTGLVEILLENSSRRLLAGSAIRAAVEVNRRPGVVLVPAEAVILSGETERTGRAVAFVADGQRALRRDVKVGVRQADQIEVTEGLKAGEQLVVQGAQFLRDQNPIKLQDEGESKQ